MFTIVIYMHGPFEACKFHIIFLWLPQEIDSLYHTGLVYMNYI